MSSSIESSGPGQNAICLLSASIWYAAPRKSIFWKWFPLILTTKKLWSKKYSWERLWSWTTFLHRVCQVNIRLIIELFILHNAINATICHFLEGKRVKVFLCTLSIAVIFIFSSWKGRWAKILDWYVLHSSETKDDKGTLGKWSYQRSL